MPWVKFSDDWYDDHELIEAGPAAMLVWPVLITWCARNLTDGKIPSGQVRRLVDWHTLGIDPEQAIAPLVANGRLQDIAGGYYVTNYLDYQPSREKVLEDREAAKVRAAKSRAPKFSARAENVREACADAAPSPVPVPDEPSSSSSSEYVNTPGLPPDLWTKVADKKATLTTSVIANPTKWKAKAAANARDDLEDRALSLVAAFDLTTSQLVEALVLPSNPPWLTHHRRKDIA